MFPLLYGVETQARIAKSWMDAMQGYTQAMTAASTAATGQMLNFWSDAARSATGAPVRHQAPVWPNLPATEASLNAVPHAVELWLSFTPFGRSPAVVQMAYGMMAFGVPRAVAMPAAEANAAVYDAVEAAVGPVQNNFSAFRTDGGHVSAHVVALKAFAAFAPFWPAAAAVAMTPMMTSSRPLAF